MVIEEEDCRERTYSNAVDIKRSSSFQRITQSLTNSPTTPNNFHTSRSWSEESSFMKENRYTKSTTPLKERRKFNFLKPIVIQEPKDFKPDYSLNNVIKIKENTNVTKLVLIKKTEEKTPMSEKSEAESVFGPYKPYPLIDTIKRKH
eukprot:gene9307-1395_t